MAPSHDVGPPNSGIIRAISLLKVPWFDFDIYCFVTLCSMWLSYKVSGYWIGELDCVWGVWLCPFHPLSPPCVVVYTLIIKGDDLQKINKLLPSHEIPIVHIFNSPQRESQRLSLFIVGDYLYPHWFCRYNVLKNVTMSFTTT